MSDYSDLSDKELLEMFKATLALKNLHERSGSYKTHYEQQSDNLEKEILKRMKPLS